ncbi:DUF5937 family protein [Streptomyces yangpuensis]|uniref:DUF5937 family protein n=1 Tax=Streptomyces yangpuensis TaxID=1648182 RepID=UPI00371926AA
MAELVFSANDLAQARFTHLAGVGDGAQLPASDVGGRAPGPRPWVDRVRPRLLAAGLDKGWLAELIGPSGYVPDFLTPAHAEPVLTPAGQWEAILASPPDRVREDLDHLARHRGHLGTRLSSLRADPSSRLAGVTQELRTYWELALAPYWARIRTVVEADVFHRARIIAERGAAHAFNDLHTSVSWEDDTLTLTGRKRAMPRHLAGVGLVLVPSAFTGPALRTRMRPPDPPQLAYPARGIGTLWETRSSTATHTLAPVLGRSRSLLLAELANPASAIELAHRTGLSPAAVSQSLTALRNAGLVSAHRAGRSVLYARTAVAEALFGQQRRLGELGVGPQKASRARKAAKTSAASGTRAGGEAFQKGLQALAQYVAREGGMPGRGAVEELADGPHRVGIWVGNQKARRDRLDKAQLAALAELGVQWAR